MAANKDDADGMSEVLSEEGLSRTSSQLDLIDKKLEGDQIPGKTDHGVSMAAEPRLRLFDGISIIFGLMVGSGIFSSAGLIYSDVGSAGLCLVIWIGTGLLAMTGALCYAELGTLIPGSGGEAPYLERGFGPWAAFIFNWTSCLLLKPGSGAIIAVAFAKYTLMAFMSGRALTGEAQEELLLAFRWPVKGIAVGCLFVCAGLCAASKDINRRSQRVLTVAKLGCLAFVLIAGVVAMIRDGTQARANLSRPFANTTGNALTVALLASALNHGLWAYEGWNNLNLVAGEVRRPARTLPLAIWISVSMTIGVYVLCQLAYFVALPAGLIARSETIGVEFGRAVMGRAGAVVMPVLIAVCIFGASLSGTYTAAEVTVYAARMGHMPAAVGRTSARLGTPVAAYAMQALLTAGLVLLSDFDILVQIYTFPAWLFYGAAVLALLVLRWREAGALRPYRVWISTPILFLVACCLLVASSFYAHPLPIGLSFGLLLLGLPVYHLLVRPDSRLQTWMRTRAAIDD